MTETFTLNDEEYEMNGDPSLRTVRGVQSMQNELLLDYVDDEMLHDLDSLDDEGEIMNAIIETGGVDALTDVRWERSLLLPVQTISLACDEKFDSEDFEEVSAEEFKELRETAEDVLDGTANDFFEELGIGTYLTEEQMNQSR